MTSYIKISVSMFLQQPSTIYKLGHADNNCEPDCYSINYWNQYSYTQKLLTWHSLRITYSMVNSFHIATQEAAGYRLKYYVALLPTAAHSMTIDNYTDVII